MNSSSFTIVTPAANSDWRELASRDKRRPRGLAPLEQVGRRVKVIVADTRLEDDFELDVAGADALAAFYHPFAFAAGRGHVLRVSPTRESLDLQPQD